MEASLALTSRKVHNYQKGNGLLIALALTVLVQSHGGAASSAKRDGGVTDWITHQPITADVFAWAGDRKGLKGDCPTFSTLLDQRTALPDGRFSLSIDPAVRVYNAVFCKSGYYPRVERQIDSESNGKVQPLPARLYPRSSDAETFRATAKDTVRRFVSDVSYLAQSRPDVFRDAVEEMRKSDVLGHQMGLDMFLQEAAARASERDRPPS